MPKIAIITQGRKSAEAYAKQILQLFSEYICVDSYAIEEGMPQQIAADVALVSTPSLYILVESSLRTCEQVIIADLTLYKSSLDKLRVLPQGTKAMLVNTTLEMAIETINLIHNSGIHHIDFFPIYPASEHIPPLTLAVTPGEGALVPPQVTRIIDLLDRVLSQKTIINLAAKLDLTMVLNQAPITSYFNKLAPNDSGIEKLLSQIRENEQRLDLIMRIFDGGILLVAGNGTISFLNPSAEKLLRRDLVSVIGHPFEEIFPEFSALQIAQTVDPVRDRVLKIGEQLMDISVFPLKGSAITNEMIIMIKTLNDIERDQYRIRRQIIAKGHIAKHYFSDIITQNRQMLQVKESAQRMAQSGSSIVIYGPSGTGKELFAQSIHNASSRKDYPFIAINCASIPESLLQSELFGYAEGAFTGAKKGGKPGYFELAHQGTLFLDEIGEMNLAIQAQLLRVLQEREVIRVGGDSVIDIDVRIISASNKRLVDLVKQKKFREDLYYRLNVLPIEIPPLRDRKEDIPLLIADFQKKIETSFAFSPEAENFLRSYPWNGNVRELENFVERTSYSGKQEISLEDIRIILECQEYVKEEPSADAMLEHFLVQEHARLDGYAAILSLLYFNKR